MSRTPTPKDGCFKATYPSTTLVEVPCTKAPDYPHIPATAGPGVATGGPLLPVVGAGGSNDWMSQVSGIISWAEGSFPSVSGVAWERGVNPKVAYDNLYSLQLNTNTFNTPWCVGHPGCSGWQQFIYEGQGGAYMEYWLLGYGSCPSGWKSYGNNCWQNSGNSAPAPGEPATSLADLTLTGVAGSSDTLTFGVGNEVYTFSQGSVLDLNLAGPTGWKSAEFNVFGDSNSHEAFFNSGSTIVVQTLTDSVSPTQNGPGCLQRSTTAETNNLNLVPNSCCHFGGTAPGIQFMESNATPLPSPQPCLLLPSDPDPNWSVGGHPFDAVNWGNDTDGANLYPCRAEYNGSVQIGKTRTDWQACDIGYGGQEVWVTPYESLVGGWVDGVGDSVPSNAVPFGTDGSGGPTLYACRAYLNGNGYQLGKVRPGLGGCSIPYGGSEQLAAHYQALSSNSTWPAGDSLPLETVNINNAAPPNGAMVGGYDADNAPLYICQAQFNGGYIPGKTRSNWSNCDVSWGGAEHFVSNYNVVLPAYAGTGSIFRAGLDSDGSLLGICRVPWQNSLQVGKYLSYGACNFGFGGQEVSLGSGYEVIRQ